MTKSKYETRKQIMDEDNTFTVEEVRNFIMGSYAAHRRQLYLEKMAQREPNPRLISGMEALSPETTVADIDLVPLSPQAHMGRFVKPPESGYDTDDHFDEHGVYQGEDVDSPDFDNDEPSLQPTPFEIRSQRLEKKLKNARTAHKKAVEERLKDGDTPTPQQQNKAPEDKIVPPKE